jgi:cytochrome c
VTLRIRRALTILLLCIIPAGEPASAQMGMADAKRGQELAARVCSGCHIVSAGSAATANADVPTFAAIAGRPDTTAERLAGRIIVPHPPMPSTQLTVAEMRDIIAYIMSLKPQR